MNTGSLCFGIASSALLLFTAMKKQTDQPKNFIPKEFQQLIPDLKNQNHNTWALVTGSTRNIGLSYAKGLATLNYNVIVTGTKKETVDQALAILRKEFPSQEFHSILLDIINEEETLKQIKSLFDRFEIDIVVLNAGIEHAGASIEYLKDDIWKDMIFANCVTTPAIVKICLKKGNQPQIN